MRLTYRLLIGGLPLLLAAGLILSNSPAKGTKKNSAPTCCKKSPSACPGQSPKNRKGELIMDNMSRQFIMINPVTY